MKKLLLILFILLLIVLMVEGLFYFGIFKTTSLPKFDNPLSLNKIKTGEYLLLKQVDAFEKPDENARVAYIAQGKYFILLGQKGSFLKIKMSRIGNSMAAEGWIKVDSSAYQEVKE